MAPDCFLSRVLFAQDDTTTLLFNGCPIGHIKDILGHEYLMTTCKYYLGADKRAAKKAHGRYLDYELPFDHEPAGEKGGYGEIDFLGVRT